MTGAPRFQAVVAAMVVRFVDVAAFMRIKAPRGWPLAPFDLCNVADPGDAPVSMIPVRAIPAHT